MALEENGNSMVMPVAPMGSYGNGGFGNFVRINFVVHNVVSPVDFELKLRLIDLGLRSPWAINVRIYMQTCSYTMRG